MESYTCVVCEPCSSEALSPAFTEFYMELYFDTFKRDAWSCGSGNDFHHFVRSYTVIMRKEFPFNV